VPKVTTLEDAVRRHVRPGSSVYITGFTHLISFAGAHEIIRQRIDGLTLIRLTPDLVYDQMVAAGCADELVFSYLGNPGVGHLGAIRRAIEQGRLRFREYTHGSLVAALRAGASGAPFAAVPALAGTDLPAHADHVQEVESPFDGARVPVVGPLRPDVAIVHVQRADEHGNAVVWGSLGEIQEAAYAARHVILTTEELVPTEQVRRDPNRVAVLGLAVDAVAVVPFGAHPSYAQGMYGRDNRFYRDWADVNASDEAVAAWLDRHVHAVAGPSEYADLFRERLTELSAVGESFSDPVNYGENAAIAAVQE
jgi:glutaconate CoA-transferase subunit A